jgi:signal transduction histidine kinase
MPLFPPKAETEDPGTALAMVWSKQRRSLRQSVLFMVLLCVAIGLVLNSFRLPRLGVHLVYAFCVGFSCWGLNNLSHLLLAWGADRWRAAKGLAPSGQEWRRWRGVAPALLLGFVLGPPLGLTVADTLTGFTSPSLLDFDSSTTRATLLISLVGSLLALWAISGIERLSSARAEAEAAQRQAAETQLRLLQSQLEPHMLFNTLANLRVLIALDAAQAQLMLDRLINFLRATLSASRTGLHPLSTEFDRIGDYLALMGVRMGLRLQVELDLPAALRELPVPPLLLQPLVENAIQHGLEPHVQGGRISVRARTADGQLVLSVRDTGSGLRQGPAQTGTGFGLAQVRERLATLHGSRARLELTPEPDAEGGTLVTVTLPLHAS